MKNLLLFLIFSCFLSSVAYSTTEMSGTTVSGISFYAPNRIYAVGDSITVGLGEVTYFSYRDHLQQTYLGLGTYDFVGEHTDPDSDAVYDVEHGAVSGTRTANVLARIQADLEKFMPKPNGSNSKVLLHIGTNDSAGSTAGVPPPPVAPEVAAANVVDIVETIVAYDSNIKIYVALIIPHRNTGSVKNNANFINFNNALGPLILTLHSSNANINLVDMYAAMNNDTFGFCSGVIANCYATGDDTHPDDDGYKTMAAQWDACFDNASAVNCNGN